MLDDPPAVQRMLETMDMMLAHTPKEISDAEARIHIGCQNLYALAKSILDMMDRNESVNHSGLVIGLSATIRWMVQGLPDKEFFH